MVAIVNHNDLPEIPWRESYRVWDITGSTVGISSNLSYGRVAPGAGAPLHHHDFDELIVVLAGVLETQVGDQTHRVGANHTIVIPPQVPHKFFCVGPTDAQLLTFFPTARPFESTTYIEGEPPAAHKKVT